MSTPDSTLASPQRKRIEELSALHPCFTETAVLWRGRMHLPVAPRCNLGCNYCERVVGTRAAWARGPGTAARLLTPAEAAARVTAIKAQDHALSVVGIAGPGEPLANPATFETLSLVHSAHPDLVLCISTNGLKLAAAVPRLLAVGLQSVTLTINTTLPDVAERLYAWADLEGARIPGAVAASEILERQWTGLASAVKAGLLVKVNSVLIPSVNDLHLAAVARRAAALGAHRHNIMPLIPRGRMWDRRAPTPHELEQARARCERWIPQFRGCTQCRADAVVPPLSAKGAIPCGACA